MRKLIVGSRVKLASFDKIRLQGEEAMLTKSEYRIYLYLKHDETFESRIVSLVENYGLETSEMVGGYKITNKSKFIQRFNEGVYALFWDEFQSSQWQRAVNLSIGLAWKVWDFDFSMALELESIFSPILQKPNALVLLGNDAEEKLDKLKNGRNPITNDIGIDLPHPSEQLQTVGVTILALRGNMSSDMSVMGASSKTKHTSLKDHMDAIHLERKSILQEIVKQLDPMYGFIADNQDEQVLCMSRHMTTWPPLEPWKFFWRLMIFGSQLSQETGVEKLRSTPALITEEFGKNLFWIQATDALYHYWSPKSSQLSASQRTNYEKSVLDYLNLTAPFP